MKTLTQRITTGAAAVAIAAGGLGIGTAPAAAAPAVVKTAVTMVPAAGSLGTVPAPRKYAVEGASCHQAKVAIGGREYRWHWWNWKWINGQYVCVYGGTKIVRS